MRNVWSAAAPGYQPQQLTQFTDDDGEELSALSLSADGTTAFFVRGGAPDAAGLSQNPQSLSSGVQQHIWAVSTVTHAARPLGLGKLPVASPDGRVVLASQGKTLSCVAVDATSIPAWCRAPLLALRGTTRSAVFSPDGTRIAFVSERADHSFIGVLETSSGRVRWLAPDFNQDDLPVWSPDGAQVAFIRRSGATFGSAFDLLGAWPFEIWVADVRSGVGHAVFHSNATAGGFAQLDLEGPPRHPLQWSAAGDLLFYSEESGWNHLYAVPVAGGPPRDLTPGPCEAESDTMSAEGLVLIVSSNCAAIDGRQLFKIHVKSGASHRLAGAAINVGPVFVGRTNDYAYRTADAMHPTAIALVDGASAASRIFPSLPSDFPLSSLIAPELVTFKAADGVLIHGQLFQARSPGASAARPGLIFVHGGPIRQMLPGWHYMDYYRNAYAMNQYLASRGFVVLSVNYRGGIGYGQGFRSAERQGPRGASEYQDVVAGRGFLAHLRSVDASRIGIWGGSYGGLLTAQALARNSDLFAAGVDFHGVHDWRQFSKDLPEDGWPSEPATEALFYDSSPVAAIERWRSPVLFIHGDDDRSVPFSQTTDLATRLRARGVKVETLVFPDEEHDFLRYSTWLRAYAAAATFLQQQLGEGH